MADQQQPPTEPLFKIEYTIGDSNGYKNKLIEELRAKVPHNVIEIKVNETAVDADGNTIEPGNHTLRVLAERKSPLQWIHIKLYCVERDGGETTWTTLAVRADNLYVKGFMNKRGRWFELWEEDDTEADGLPIHTAEKLEGWGVMYRKILRLSEQGQVVKILTSTRLGRAFAERAVRRLSRYPYKDQDDDMPTRMGLAGLILLVCEAARMERLSERIATGWDAEGTIVPADMAARIWEWKNTSASLLQWLANARLHWDRRCQIEDPAKALKLFYLLLNSKKVEGSGRARVEISKVTADFHVCGITVVDEEDRHIRIYTDDGPDVNKEHEMRELVLKNALKMGISGYKGFNVIVKSQRSDGAPDHINMKWDCRKNVGGNIELVTRDIHLENPKRRMNFTYLVMSDAIEVKVEVMVKLGTDEAWKLDNAIQTMEHLITDGGQGDSGGKYTARGKITARIDGNEHKILLFSHEEDKVVGRRDLKKLWLPIRSDVPVRRGKPLHIDMDMVVSVTNVASSSSEQVVAAWTDRLSIAPQTTEVPCRTIHGDVRLKVTWPTPAKEETEQQQQPPKTQDESHLKLYEDMVVGDDGQAFSTSIEGLREFVIKHSRSNVESSSSEDFPIPPVLPVPCKDVREASLVHIKIKVKAATGKEKEAEYSTTLAVRTDKFYGVGFRNKCGVWFDLGMRNEKILPAEYSSVLLGWTVNYRHILQAKGWYDDVDDSVVSKLNDATKLGKKFAGKAVRMLSSYPDVEEDPEMNPKLALAGLMIMVCESAKLDHLRRDFEDAWDRGMVFKNELIDYMMDWGPISGTLLYYKENNGVSRPGSPTTVNMGFTSVEEAKEAIGLVYNYRCPIGDAFFEMER